MRRGYTTSELIASLCIVILVPFLVMVIIVLTVGLNHYLKSKATIKVEAVTPTQVHPISGEFSTGYILVEIWTMVERRVGTPSVVHLEQVPHIVRMKRSEYIELMNQSPNP